MFKTPRFRMPHSEIEFMGSMQLYPNPSNGNFLVSLNIKEHVTIPVLIQIYNVSGQVVFSRETIISEGNLQEEFNLPNHFAPGTYFVKIRANDKMYSSRLVIQL